MSASGITGGKKKEVMWPGEASRQVAAAAKAVNDARGGNKV